MSEADAADTQDILQFPNPQMKAISKLRFKSFAGYVRDAVLLVTVEELEWDQDGNEKVIGVVRDVFDNDFGYVVLGRDALKRFPRCRPRPFAKPPANGLGQC
jgi:hypothetical protein